MTTLLPRVFGNRFRIVLFVATPGMISLSPLSFAAASFIPFCFLRSGCSPHLFLFIYLRRGSISPATPLLALVHDSKNPGLLDHLRWWCECLSP